MGATERTKNDRVRTGRAVGSRAGDAPGAWRDRAWPAAGDHDVFEASRARAAARGGFRGGEKLTLTLAGGADAKTKVVVRLARLHSEKRFKAAVKVRRAGAGRKLSSP